MTAPSRVAGSFRDPAGFVYVVDGVIHRQVNAVGADDYDHLMTSGLFAALVAQGLLIEHEEMGAELAAAPGAHRVLRPAAIPHISYPYEWSFSQLQDAALLTLDIAEAALSHGAFLRDASAFNVQFRGVAPVFIDTLSFGRRTEGEPWIAYRQFVQHFLAPLALMAYRDVSLGRLSMLHLDGVPLDLASTLLPRRTRSRPGLAIHIHGHARASIRHASRATGPARRARFSDRAFLGLLSSLRSTVTKLEAPRDSHWADYYDDAQSYTETAFGDKERIVTELLARIAPTTVWDLGANTGAFSRIAARGGARTIAYEMDAVAADAAYRSLRDDDEVLDILPLVGDLVNPAPAIGWAHEERTSWLDRGPADCALALALVHHLAIGNNVGLPTVAALLARLCTDAIVEWVPKTDPMVQRLLATREDVFPDYDQGGFEAAMGGPFEIVSRDAVGDSERTVYHLRRR